MQIKIIIGTIAFMLTMIILGFATLLEPARLQETTAAFEGRQIENGAALFEANCAECHGVNGQALECFDAAGNAKGCVGLPLNHAPLQCEDAAGKTERMIALNWTGSKSSLIMQTIAAGRIGTLMPVWSQEFGGPMEPYQIEQVTAYVLNWGEDPALCGEEAAPVETIEWPESVADLPAGDAANGETLYFTTYVCNSCHGDPAVAGSNAVGPHLGEIGTVGGDRIAGLSATDYIYQSILHPNDFIAPICANDQPCTEPSSMPPNFGQRMTEQDMADVIEYLLQQGN
jgi:mono/diheme cytochrome c family protein